MRVGWKFIGRAQAYATRLRLPQPAELDLRTPDGSEVVLPTGDDFLILLMIGSGEAVQARSIAATWTRHEPASTVCAVQQWRALLPTPATPQLRQESMR